MTVRTLVATTTLAFAAAGTAVAQEATLESAFPTIQSVASRVTLQADAKAARARGDLHEVAQITARHDVRGNLTRAAVRADARQALLSGEIDRLNFEAYGYDGQIGRPAANVRLAGMAR